MLRHVVIFQWKTETAESTIREIEETFSALPSKIPQIIGYEWGRDISVQGFDRDYTHVFVVTLASEADRDVYLPHPDHMRFIALSRPNVEKILVLDYVPTDVAGDRH